MTSRRNLVPFYKGFIGLLQQPGQFAIIDMVALPILSELVIHGARLSEIYDLLDDNNGSLRRFLFDPITQRIWVDGSSGATGARAGEHPSEWEPSTTYEGGSHQRSFIHR